MRIGDSEEVTGRVSVKFARTRALQGWAVCVNVPRGRGGMLNKTDRNAAGSLLGITPKHSSFRRPISQNCWGRI